MQGMKLLRAVTGTFALLLLAAPAYAVMSLPYGWYLEGNAGSTTLTEKSYPGRDSSSGVGYNASVGYKFMPYFAMEAGYSRYAQTIIKDAAGNKAGTDNHDSYQIVGKGIIPVYESGFELFAKLGATRVASDLKIDNASVANSIGLGGSSHNDINIFFGFGGQYYFMPELAVVGQWQRAVGNSSTGTMGLVSGGISFIFG